MESHKKDKLFERLLELKFDINKPPKECSKCGAKKIMDCTCKCPKCGCGINEPHLC